MSLVMGMLWVQRFGGLESELKFGERQAQIETMLSFQPISDAQKADFIIGFLDGEAKREILTVGRAERNTPYKIFAVLSKLYGGTTHVSVLRTQFFNCRHGNNISYLYFLCCPVPRPGDRCLRSFSLRLRELFFNLS